MTSKLPEGWRLVAPGKLTRNGDGTETYDTVNPLEGLDIAAAPWLVMEDEINGQRVAVYTLPGTPSELANTYLLATGDYLKRFTAEVGPHPWPQFLVVEHILPTGYGLPSMTLLGGAVMRLPFIVKTSLGHEVLHDWWGNGVYVDRTQGNWCEGLTAYMADHAFSAEENRDGGRDYRTQILRDYREYTAHGKDDAVADFRERHDARERAIGYGKVAMIFHMLRVQLGPDKFQQAVRQLFYEFKYKEASWGNIQDVFSRTAETDLSWFFKQWVNTPGAPELGVGKPRIVSNDEKSAVKVTLSATPGWQMMVPMDARETNGRVFDGFGSIQATGQGEGHVSLPAGVTVGEVVIDPEVDLFRRLSAEEVPASLARYLAAPPDLIVLGSGRDGLLETARRIADKVGEGKIPVRRDLDVTPEMLAQAQRVLWLGRPADTALGSLVKLPAGVVMDAARLATSVGGSSEEDAAIVLTLDNPKPGTGVLLVVDVLRAPQLDVVMQKIVHYGKYSFLVFGAGRAQVKGVWPAPSSPLRVAM
ncbi:MAG: M1 family aminopeptidase [Acidobacteriota bacterium]